MANLKVFKLNYSGSFEEIDIETVNLMDFFTLVDVLAVYIPMQKRMYIWVGKKVTQSLRNFVPGVRTRFSEKLPDLRILRNITVESGSEPMEFFSHLNITFEQLNSHIKEIENKLQPIIDEIDRLKENLINLVNTEKFEEAIKVSEEIIEFSKKINDKALENEQKDNIKDLKEKAEQKTSIDKVWEETNRIRLKFEELIASNKAEDIIEAHNTVEEYKKKYEGNFDLYDISSAEELIMKDDNIWNSFTREQNEAIKELRKSIKEITSHMERNEFKEAEKILIKARELLIRVVDADLKNQWGEIEINLLENKKKYYIIEEIERSIEESSILTNSLQFEEAIARLESTIESIQDKDILEYSNKIKEKKSEILSAQEEYNSKIEKINVLEEKFNENRRNNHLNAAIINCENILKISESIKKHETLLKYSQILDQINNEMEEINRLEKQNQEELIKKSKELESIIVVDENVIPLIEEFSVNDIIGDLSDDINEMLEQVGNLLSEHRVEVKKEISNKTILTSVSGEVLEVDKKIEVKKVEEEEKIEYNVQSGLINPFEDSIEEAIITDLIPYNFEITDVQLNGENVRLPDKSLTKDGIEIKWKMHNIPPKEKVEINYDLRRRVSRTIIFILKKQLKIIKTHSNLSTLDIEGLYEAKLPFTNSFGETLDSVIVEDIVPLYYLHFIKEPTEVLPAETITSKLGELIKWNVGTMEPKTLNYNYRLLELYRYEEIKINISDLAQKGIDSLDIGDISKALGEYEKIIYNLEEYNK